MKRMRRLLVRDADPFEKALLESARVDGASGRRGRTLAALGLGIGAAGGAGASGTAAAGLGEGAMLLATKWVGIAAVGALAVGTSSVAFHHRAQPERSVERAPAVHAPTLAPARS